jgi:hypothetical protein
MAILLATQKRLWANSGRICAFPGCEQRLLLPLESEDGEVAVGRECHIVAKSDGGPRGPTSLDAEERERWAPLIERRDAYANLILLCGTHHDLVDADEAAYPVERLVEMKRLHEQAIDDLLSSEQRHEDAIEVRYATIVDGWARRIDLDGWGSRVSKLVADAVIREEVLDGFVPVREWLLTRVWPRTLPALEEAFVNYRLVSEDLEAVATRYATRRGGLLLVDRVYQEVSGPRAEPDNLRFLEERSEYYQDLAADLTVELTRAVNLVCDRVREHLWANYRLEEGYATVGLGLDASLRSMTLRPLYPPDAAGIPYPGLKRFVSERAQRDWARGEGLPPDGARLPGLA